ncbi:AbrB family transcriptional regulator [Hansschlegelia quercus]|uniref:AbrB family transcriptional regulator n=1 Tax=Hansschlegelia quercus TaxID=2528245 RepID=A0A4Q9GHG5_9HYPH|nr:AbrB family transcriptional regulator [Hansschlegelia quercus]TBN53619.1 AbrB family transcriptional regulator [Hansschlegelia quercus]
MSRDPERLPALARRPALVSWATLAALAVPLIVLLELMGFPAAVLVGSMIASITVAVSGGKARAHRGAFLVAQGVVGCLIGHGVPASALGGIVANWPLLIGPIVAVTLASSLLGWAIARSGVLPGTTAVWGSSPGAAAAMTLMSQSYGADFRLVAFMQYARVVMVVATASIVSRVWIGPTDATARHVFFPNFDWRGLLVTVAVVGFGVPLARALKIPAGPLLVPMAVTIALQDAMGVTLALPPWLLVVAFSVMGVSIGTRFTREILAHAARALPQILLSIFALIAICAFFAWTLVAFGGIDPLTAYLATSPGGADSVAIIAATANVDASFVMALQTGRLIFTLLAGPGIAQFIAARVEAERARKVAAP